jgi:hypothetical protein
MEVQYSWGELWNMTPGVRLDRHNRGILSRMRRNAASDRPIEDTQIIAV